MPSLDLPDHTLTTISTWAEVAILFFMLWEGYGSKLGFGPMIAQARPSGLWGILRENRTLILAAAGLVIVIWVHFVRTPETVVVHEGPTTEDIAKIREPVEKERDDLKRDLAEIQSKLDVATQRLSAPQKPSDAPAVSSFAQTYVLANSQIRELRDEIFSIKNFLPPHMSIQLVDEPSARVLTNQLARAFDLGGVDPSGISIGHPSSPQDVGIMIRVGDLQAIPDGAKKIAAAIKKVTGVDPRFIYLNSLKSDEFNLLIGPNPNG